MGLGFRVQGFLKYMSQSDGYRVPCIIMTEDTSTKPPTDIGDSLCTCITCACLFGQGRSISSQRDMCPNCPRDISEAHRNQDEVHPAFGGIVGVVQDFFNAQ